MTGGSVGRRAERAAASSAGIMARRPRRGPCRATRMRISRRRNLGRCPAARAGRIRARQPAASIMALKHLTEEEIKTWTREQKDEWWLREVYRGDMAQLTVRSALMGFFLGGILSATAMYIS